MTFSLQDLHHPARLQALAEALAQITERIGHFLQAERAAFDPSRVEHKGLNDLVSYVDRQAEQQAIAALQALLPEAGFVTEEGTLAHSDGRTHPGPGAYWIIDPLDGTTNYIHGLGIYACSIALLHERQLRVGAIAVPVRQEVFMAWQGGGAYLNGQRLAVSPATTFGQSLLATGFPYQRFERMAEYLAVIEQMMHTSHGLRRMGSAAVDLAWTAAGRFEGFFEYNLKAWDAAAGILLVQEAGGTVTDFRGGEDYLFGGEIIAAGGIHAPMLDLIGRHWYPA